MSSGQASDRKPSGTVSSSAKLTRRGRAPLLTKTWHSHPVRILALCGLVLGGAIISATALLLSDLHNRAIADKGHELTRSAAVLAEHIDNTFRAVSEIENNLVEQLRIRGVDTPESFARLRSSHELFLRLKEKNSDLAYVEIVSLIDARGILLNWSRSWPAPELDFSVRKYFQSLKADQALTTYMSEPLRNLSTGLWTVYIARKITNSQGDFLGAVVGAIELPRLEEFFRTIAPVPDGVVSLRNLEGVLLARYPPTPDRVGKPRAANPVFNDVMANKPAGFARVTSTFDGQERLIGSRRLANYPAVVGVGTTIDATLAEWRKGATYLVIAAILLMALIAGIILVGTQRVSIRLREDNLRLDGALSNMSQGLCMFDAQARVVVCNDRYIEMYDLSRDIVRPGCTLDELISHRIALGQYSWSSDQRRNHLLAKVALRQTTTEDIDIEDGRTIRIVNRPMADGGWVATHEDISDVKRRDASFRLLFKGNPIPMWVHDAETLQIFDVNDAAIAHYGYSRERFHAMTVLDMRSPEDGAALRHLLAKTDNDEQRELTGQHRKADGSYIDVLTYSRSLQYDGRPARLVAATDITERKRAEDALRSTKAFLDTILENVPVPLLVKEPKQLRYIFANRATEQLLGLSRADIVGKDAFDLFSTDLAESVTRRDNDLLESNAVTWTQDHPMLTPGNGWRLVSSKRVLVRGDDGEPRYLVGVLEDHTERRRSELRIAHMAHHDALTDLPNRFLLRERLEQALAQRGEQLAVFYLDVDHFKDINDTLGHLVGDELLKVVADRLRGCVAPTDTVARLGGDEFAIIRSVAEQPADAAELAKAIRAAIRPPFNLVGHQIVANVSIGIAVAPHDGTSAGELLKNADLALYGAKSQGRDTYRFFEPDMEKRIKARRELEFDLRNALANHEFELHYQPLVSLDGNRVTGVEALLRWRHPERGMIPPATFIALAEEIGLIVPIGEWVLRRACEDAATWPADIKLSVNLSPAQLMNQSLVPLVVSALARARLPAQRLEIEITEAILMQNNEATVNALHQLRALGVRVAMDDFGTGYSSLSYLRSFPFDRIKIDQSFIKGLPNDEGCLAIIRAIVTLAKSLRMATTAEGVETELQREIVHAEGCTTMQGYLFSPAVPAADVMRFFSPCESNAVESDAVNAA